MRRCGNQSTIVDIARKAGVSNGLVAHVLNGVGKNNIRVGQKTASRIRRIAEEMNYKPNLIARQLVGKKSKMIGAFCAPVVSELNYARIVRVGEIARENGYHLMVTFGELKHDEEFIKEAFEDFALRGVEGLICMLHHYVDAPNLVANLANTMFEHVIFIDEPNISNAHYVGADFKNGAQQAVKYLLDRGRKKIGLILTDLEWVTGPQLLDGYTQQLSLHGMKIENKRVWVRNSSDTIPRLSVTDPPSIEEAEDITEKLIVKEGCDAVICGTDFWAAELISFAQMRGFSVPDDVSVVGFGNLKLGKYISPKLTTFDCQVKLIAEQAFTSLHRLIENKDQDEPRGISILPKIIEREST